VLLLKSEMTVAQVAENFQMMRVSVKKLLSVLSDGGLVSVRPHGHTKVNALSPDGMKRVTDWLSFFDTFWGEKLASLKNAIEKAIQ
jgi:DNA-binding GntR family transcriptional regulator